MMLNRTILFMIGMVLPGILFSQCDLRFENTTFDYFVCPGSSVELEPVVAGGTSPFNYLWTSVNDSVSIAVANPVFSKEGIYNLKVTDKKGCIITVDFTVSSYFLNPFTLGPDLSICKGDTAKIYNSPLGAYKNIQWSPSDGLSSSSILEPVIKPEQSTAYTLTAMDENDCLYKDTIHIQVFSTPAINKSFTEVEINSSQNYTVNGITITGGIPPYSYSWFSSNPLELLPQSPDKYRINPTLSPAQTTEYTLEVYDRNSCKAQDKIILKVK